MSTAHLLVQEVPPRDGLQIEPAWVSTGRPGRQRRNCDLYSLPAGATP